MKTDEEMYYDLLVLKQAVEFAIVIADDEKLDVSLKQERMDRDIQSIKKLVGGM